jgi:hypothetical protein
VATSKLPAILDYLTATFTAASTLGAATPPVAVYDGPVITQAPDQLILWVGMDDPDSDEAPTSAFSEQTWAGLGAQAKDEQFTVNCVAEAWGGETDIAAIRTAAFAIVAAVENLVRGDVMLGGRVQFQGVTGLSLRQDQTTRGAVARVTFQITGQARI